MIYIVLQPASERQGLADRCGGGCGDLTDEAKVVRMTLANSCNTKNNEEQPEIVSRVRSMDW